jgi:TolB-like protein/Tfp pilus assembly protein PilF
VVAVSVWWVIRSRAPQPVVPSIAVLPFLSLGGGPGSEYVADGFVEDLTTELARLPGLRVAARTSAFQFRGRNEDMRQIGARLGVAAVLEGSVRHDPGKLHVTAQLISTQTGFHLWSDAYDKPLAALPEAQTAVMRAVAETFALRRDLTRARRHAPPAEALDAYWRGRYLRSNPQHRAESLSFLQQAVQIDPKFAEAWAALASTYATMSFHQELPRESGTAQAREAAHRALELDDSIAEAHAALAQLAYSYDMDFPAAERDYTRALELNPSAAGTLRGYALALVSQSRFDEAFHRLETVRQIDPLSLQTGNDLATAYYCARRFDDAIRVARQRLDAEPGYAPAWMVTGSSLALSGKSRDGAAALRKAVETTRILGTLSRLGHALALSGQQAEARAVLGEMQSPSQPDEGSGVALAMVYTGLGETKNALESLRRAVDARETDTTFLAVEPIFAPLHTEPAFRELCARLHLPLK